MVELVVAGHHKEISYLKDFITDNYTEADEELNGLIDDGLDYDTECGKLVFTSSQKILEEYGFELPDKIKIADIDSFIKEVAKYNLQCNTKNEMSGKLDSAYSNLGNANLIVNIPEQNKKEINFSKLSSEISSNRFLVISTTP